jgi:deoxyinosine 3'endonuclease (endonuclease V)
MNKKGTIERLYKERPKKTFKIFKDCLCGKLCKKMHIVGNKMYLQKRKETGQIIYSIKNQTNTPTSTQNINQLSNGNTKIAEKISETNTLNTKMKILSDNTPSKVKPLIPQVKEEV